jgi:hypothetical protein
MIGVLANPQDYAVIREFFELFKTPWEFFRPHQPYDVLLCCGDVEVPEHGGAFVVIYAGLKISFDGSQTTGVVNSAKTSRVLEYQGFRIPLYGEGVTFRDGAADLVEEGSHLSVVIHGDRGERWFARVGYDLCGEIRTLLTDGQPASHAGTPTLELHVAILRDLIVASGAPLIEIPPVPKGYSFLACLTHDVDHPSQRLHRFDHTMVGFLYRATLGSFLNLFRGRLDGRGLWRNLAAAAKLPLVYLGVVADPWSEFDRYAKIENGLASTFFVIPFRGVAGVARDGRTQSRRASAYGAADISSQIRTLAAKGCEIGTHGIDAWRDTSRGRAEFAEVGRIAGREVRGIRMHWLYFDEHSPSILEQAGAEYDSTVGYNETIGYRAGTTQVYRPLDAERLLELPLHVMDTALFYPSYLNLSGDEARARCAGILENAARWGGCVTVNWHDRSIAPERLWDDFYLRVISDLKAKEPWFATASQAVAWFRKRRSATFEDVRWESGELHVRIAAEPGDALPELEVRIYNGRESDGSRTRMHAEEEHVSQ